MSSMISNVLTKTRHHEVLTNSSPTIRTLFIFSEYYIAKGLQTAFQVELVITSHLLTKLKRAY